MSTISSSRTVLGTGYAEPREQAPRLALLDDFDGDPQGFPHGQAVESVLLSHSDLDPAQIQRMQNEPQQADLTRLIKENKLDFLTAFRTMTARNIAKFYLSTATNLHTILREQPSVQVISQSQGETTARQLEQIYDGLRDNEAFRTGVAQSLGMGPDAKVADICKTLLDEADAVAGRNEICQKARQEYLKAAKAVHDKGIVYLVAAGNHGAFARELQNLGVETSPSAFRSIFVSDYVTVVGANDAQGQESSLNSPHAGIEARALGEDLAWQAGEGFNTSGVHSGTSFATPIVAGEVLRRLDTDPGLTPFQLETGLMGLDSYQVRAGAQVPTSNGQALQADGRIESYILDKLGDGFITDIFSPDAGQLAQAKQDSTFFGLPGQVDHEFQLVRMSLDPDGQRQLSVDTYFDEGHHVLQATAKDGAWDPATVVEELHLDKDRQQQIEAAAG